MNFKKLILQRWRTKVKFPYKVYSYSNLGRFMK